MFRFEKVDFTSIRQKLDDVATRVQTTFGDDIVALYLFGSVASGSENPLSDIDLAVLFKHDLSITTTDDLTGDLLSLLYATLETQEIDLLVLNNAPLSVQFGVLSNKQLLFTSSRKRLVDYETYVTMTHLDIKPHRDEFNRHFVDTLANGGLI